MAKKIISKKKALNLLANKDAKPTPKPKGVIGKEEALDKLKKKK
ncbi:MAG: hypothetical protein P8P30_06135 [Rickettsiales bacterium]|nr:hypothetical protein [Rickettsiales bacterium]